MAKQIPLSTGLFALVDDRFYDMLMAAGPWYLGKDKRYPFISVLGNRGRQATRSLHVVIINDILERGWKSVDHKDGNKLNNLLSNLRPATHAQNLWNRGRSQNNTSGFKGVKLDKKSGRWRADVTANHCRYYLGTFSTPEEAARAYDEAACELHGKYARLNLAEVA